MVCSFNSANPNFLYLSFLCLFLVIIMFNFTPCLFAMIFQPSSRLLLHCWITFWFLLGPWISDQHRSNLPMDLYLPSGPVFFPPCHFVWHSHPILGLCHCGLLGCHHCGHLPPGDKRKTNRRDRGSLQRTKAQCSRCWVSWRTIPKGLDCE